MTKEQKSFRAIELNNKRAKELGLTLLEVVLSLGILSVLAVAGVSYFRSIVQGVNLNATAQNIVSVLRDARSRAIAGQSSMKWGVNFVNSSTDYYELFSTPTTYTDASASIDTTYYLPGTAIFSSPPNNATNTILFGKITGTISATTTVTISFENISSTITVTASGNVHL